MLDLFWSQLSLSMVSLVSPVLTLAFFSSCVSFLHMFSLLQTKYVCPSEIHVLKPNPDGDGVRRWGLEEVLRMGPPEVGLEPFFIIETAHSLATP